MGSIAHPLTYSTFKKYKTENCCFRIPIRKLLQVFPADNERHFQILNNESQENFVHDFNEKITEDLSCLHVMQCSSFIGNDHITESIEVIEDISSCSSEEKQIKIPSSSNAISERIL